jgi:hypothetical protein
MIYERNLGESAQSADDTDSEKSLRGTDLSR